uniref:AP-4 complex subunit epsilon-1 C-terminal domain-containing protein n=1 Tax=Oryzias melastigma TaxID=30732 RepID=A0A3B3CAR9_ORYME
RSPGQQGDADSCHSRTPTANPEGDREKQQLASSLFGGLSSQSSVCLVSFFIFSFTVRVNSHLSQLQCLCSLIYCNVSTINLIPVDFEGEKRRSHLTNSEPIDSSTKQTFQHPQSLRVPNGACDAEAIISDDDTKGRNRPVSPEEHVEGDDFPPCEDKSKDLSLTAHLPAELSGFSHSEIIPLCSNRSLDLSACHVQTDNTVVLVVFVTNSSEDANLQIQVCCPCESPVEEVRGHSVSVRQYSLTVKRPLVHFELVGRLSYSAAGTLQSMQFSYKLPLTSFIRPLTVSTEEYGSMWLAFSHDTKQNLTLMKEEQEPLSATLNALKKKLSLHVVEIIGVEGLVACSLLQDQPCLMHCRVHAGRLAVWLRSPVADLPDCLLYHCQRALQEH